MKIFLQYLANPIWNFAEENQTEKISWFSANIVSQPENIILLLVIVILVLVILFIKPTRK